MGDVPATPAAGDPRPALSLVELLELLVREQLLSPQQSRDIEARSTTLRSRVLKEHVGSVRSQAAARYEVSPAEVVAAAQLPHPAKSHRRIDEEAIAECVARAAKLRYLKIDPLRLDNDLISKTFSRPFVRHHVVIPVGTDNGALQLALCDPFDSGLRETLADIVKGQISYVVASKRDIVAVADRVYGFRKSIHAAESDPSKGAGGNALVELVQLRSSEELALVASSDEAVVAAVDFLLNYAYEQRASDIHFEPRARDAVVRFRIDGILHDIESFPRSVHAAITSRIKVMARMDIAERRRPQDGRIKTQRADKETELRVASLAT